jgi:hypothetical protein
MVNPLLRLCQVGHFSCDDPPQHVAWSNWYLEPLSPSVESMLVLALINEPLQIVEGSPHREVGQYSLTAKDRHGITRLIILRCPHESSAAPRQPIDGVNLRDEIRHQRMIECRSANGEIEMDNVVRLRACSVHDGKGDDDEAKGS